MPGAHRIDSNQAEIVRKIRSCPGLHWTSLPPSSHLGDGLLRAGWWDHGVVVQVEIKDEKGKLKPHQEKLVLTGQTVVVRSFDDVKEILDRIGRRFEKGGWKVNETYISGGD